MDDSQVTGSTSSYARKYAMNGMFCIDDTKDADNFDNSKPQVTKSSVDIAAVAKECGYTSQQVCETFNPALASLKDIQDPTACAAYLRANKL